MNQFGSMFAGSEVVDLVPNLAGNIVDNVNWCDEEYWQGKAGIGGTTAYYQIQSIAGEMGWDGSVGPAGNFASVRARLVNIETDVSNIENDYLLRDGSLPMTGNLDMDGNNIIGCGNVTVSDNSWIGLGAAKGRIEFDDQAVDEVNFLDCNVGIGTASPASPSGFAKILEVYDASSAVVHTNSGGTYKAEFGISSSGGWLGTHSGHAMRFATNAEERVRIDSAGNVGINDTSPSHRLDVNGTFRVTGTAQIDGASLTVADNTWIGLGAAAGRIEFDDQVVDEINFLDCKVGILTTSPDGTLSIWAGSDYHTAPGTPVLSMRQSNAPTYGFDIHQDIATDGDLHFHRVIGGASSMFLTVARATGYVGVNDTSPAHQLDVDGTLRATGAVTLDSTLRATGAVTLDSTLDVDGHAAFGSTGVVSINVALAVSDTISVGGTNYGISFVLTAGASMDFAVGLYSSVSTTATAITLGTSMGLFVDQGTKGATSIITNNYGIYIADMTNGGTLNYALYSVGGDVYFGGDTVVGGSLDAQATIKDTTAVYLTIDGGTNNQTYLTGFVGIGKLPTASSALEISVTNAVGNAIRITDKDDGDNTRFYLTANASGAYFEMSTVGEVIGVVLRAYGDSYFVNDVAIGKTSADFALDVSLSDEFGDNGIQVTNIHGGAQAAGYLKLRNDGGSPAVNDTVGRIDFAGDDDGGVETIYAQIEGVISDETGGTEDGIFRFSTMRDSTLLVSMTLNSIGDLYAIGNVGIGINPIYKLHLYSAAAANVSQLIHVDNATGDPSLLLSTNTTDWYVGIDNSIGDDSLMIGRGLAVGTTPSMIFSTAGNVTIGATAAHFKLDVDGFIGILEGSVLTWHDSAGQASGSIWVDTDDIIRFQTTFANTERLKIDASGNLLPSFTNKTEDLGQAGNAWDDCYADDFVNEADYYFLDDRPDLEALRKVKGSGIYDPINGLELIDDDSLPEWILKRNKKDGIFPNEVPYRQGDIARSPETGNPYLSGKAVDSWLMGAIRELDRRVDPIDKIREMVDKLGGVEKVKPALEQLMAA